MNEKRTNSRFNVAELKIIFESQVKLEAAAPELSKRT